MKKRIVLICMIILVALITSFSIASSFAKYKEEKSSTDEARVAKWDINYKHDIDLFKDSNESGTIKSLNGDNVIAPGSSGEYNFTITGAPETSYTLTVEALKLEDPTGKLSFKLDNCEFSDVDELNVCLRRTYRPKVYAPNTAADYDDESEEQIYHTISWSWEDDGTPNKSDTDLGSSAIIDKNHPEYDNQKKVSIVINVEAEQVIE